MRKNDYIKTMRAMHMPDDMRARIAQRMAQENEYKEVSISMFKHKKKRMAAAVIAATVVVGRFRLCLWRHGNQSDHGNMLRIGRLHQPAECSQQCQRDAGLHRLCYRALIMDLHSKTA